MAKDLLLNVLVDILGNYVAGLTKENLKIGVWAGKIELFNLKLKSTALDQFHLPVQVNKGSLQKLKLKIPWASLDRKPVKVIIDGIYLEASPIDLMKLSSSEIKSMIRSTKLKILEQAEQVIINMMQTKDSLHTKLKKTSYLQQLTSKILDNIEFQITNIHIRYVDDQSMPGLTFSTGFMVESLSLNTTDDNWCSAFINRSTTSSVDTEKTESPAIHKLGTIKNMSIYWNSILQSSDSKSSSSSDLDQHWEKKMYAMIYSQKEYVEESEYLDTKIESMDYVLYPFNECTIKIIHRQVCNEFTPNTDVIVESGTLDFNMNEIQYQQLSAVNKYFIDLDRKKFLISHRPLKRPTEDPRSWWHYAYKLIVKKEVILGSKMHLMVDCMRAKSIYVPYYKKVITYQEILRYLDLSDEDFNKYRNNLLIQQPLEIKRIIDEIPSYVVVSLHQQAAREAVVEIQKLQTDPQLLQLFLVANDILVNATKSTSKAVPNVDSNASKTKFSIFSMFSSSKTNSTSNIISRSTNQDSKLQEEQIKLVATDVEDEIAILKLEAALEQVSLTSNEQQIFSLRLKLISNATLQIGFTAKPIAKLIMPCKAQLELRHYDVLVSFAVERLDITDLISNNPVSDRIVSVLPLPYTVLVKEEENKEEILQPYFQVEVTLKPNKSFLRLKSKPILLLLNEPFINQSILFFTSSSTIIQDHSIYKRTMKNSSSYATSSFNVYAENNLDIQMEIFAPVILIPENYNSPLSGTLRLEAGPIIVHGNIDKTCMNVQINAQDLNIAMPKNFYNEYCNLLNITHNNNTTEVINKKTSFMNNIKNKVDFESKDDEDDNSYLVKPFNILCDVEVMTMSSQSNAGISLKVSIPSQTVDMQLDPIKLIRLESLFHLLYRSIIIHILQATARAANSTSISLLFVEDIDFTKTSLSFQLLIPKAICSIYTTDSSRDKVMELTFNGIQTTIVDRTADLNIEFVSDSVIVNDSLQRNILVTPDSAAVKIIYRNFKSLGSPIYNGYAHELSILCNEVLINLETKTILMISQNISTFNEIHLTYFENNTIATPINSISDQQPLISVAVINDNMIHNIANSTILSISLNSVGVKLFETQNECAFYICAKNISLYVEQNDLMFKQNNNSPKVAVQVLAKAGDILKLEVAMTDLIIQDLRSISSSCCYNTIITSNRVVSLLDGNKVDATDIINTTTTNNNTNAHLTSKVMKSEHLLSIFLRRKAQNLDIEVSCVDIHAFITPEPLLALIKSSMQIIDAIKVLYEAILNNHWYISNMNTSSVNHNIKGHTSIDLINERMRSSSTIVGNSKQSNDCTICSNITCTFINPRLFILENSEKKSTKAFVFDGNIKCVYMHNASINLNASNVNSEFDGNKHKTITSNELNELIYISLTNAQLLVSNDICIDSISHKIIEPIWIDIQIKRNSENNIILMNDLKITSDGMLSRVSLNDLALSMSILKKAKTHMIDIFGNNNNNNNNNSNLMDVKFIQNNSNKKTLEFKSVAVFKIFINIKQMQLMLINDFNNHNELPMFRINIKEIDSTLNGTLSNLEGECMFILSMEYFNSLISYSMSYWEPMIEPWQPTIFISHDFNGLRIVLDSDRIFQVNLSGTMFRSIHETILLLSKIDKDDGNIVFESKAQRYPISIHNELGLPILLYSSKTKQEIKLFDKNNNSYRIPSSSETSSSSSSNMFDDIVSKSTNQHALHYDDTFDIHLTGELAQQHQPILHASIYSTKPKRYKFQLVNTSLALTVEHKRQKYTEPIQEEIFENQRYYPLKGSWAEPWTNMGDPALFTDVHGQSCKNPKAFVCPNKDWYWVEPDWKLDIGKIGVETDRDGWQYETIFGAFSTSRFKRRSQLPLDSVRRRRWIRSRLPIQNTNTNTSNSNNSTNNSSSGGIVTDNPWMLYWDVYMRSDDVREIYISSGVHIRNELPYSLEIEMVEASGIGITTKITLPESQRRFLVDGKNVFGIPINLVNCNHIRLRPFDMQFDWSDNIVYKQQSKVISANKSNSKMQRIVCMNTKNNQPFYLTIHIVHTNDKKILITCSSSLIIANRLPCPISILCMNPSSSSFGGTVRCSTAILSPGGLIDESHIDVHQTISLNLSVGSYSSLEPVEICYDEEQCNLDSSHIIYNDQVLLYYHNNKSNPELMSVTLKSVLSKLGVLEIYIYSQYLLVDLSYSNIVISTDWSKGAHIESNTTNLITDMFSSKSSVKDDPSILIKRYSYQSSHRNDSSEAFKILFDQVSSELSNDLSTCWASGNNGVSLFQANKDNKISLGINAGGGWLSNLSLNSLTRNKMPIEIVDSTTKNACNITMILQPLTDLHSLCPTRILKIIPCYTIINYMNETIELLHPDNESLDDQQSFAVESKCSRAWHRPGNFSSTNVRLRCGSSTGSIGYFDLNEIGTTLLILPKKQQKECDLHEESIHTASDDDGKDWIVANIEVKFAETKDQSYINIIIWRSCMKHYKDGTINASIVSLSIKNDTDISFTIEQDGMDDILSTKIGESVLGSLSEVRSRYELCVKAKKWLPFGWMDSNRPKVLAVSAGQTPSKTGILCTIDTLLYEVEKVIDLSYCGSVNIKLSLVTYGYGKVLHIYKDINEKNNTKQIEEEEEVNHLNEDNWKDSSITLKLLLKSISLSLFAETPYRRELFSIHFEKFESRIQHSATNSKLKSANIIFELKLRDIQIDNYADNSTHPVLLTSACGEDRRKENKQKMRSQYLQSTRNLQNTSNTTDPTITTSTSSVNPKVVLNTDESIKDEYQSFIECSMVREIHAHNKTSPIIKYFALRILEMNVSINSSSILEYFIDLHQDIIYNPNLIDAKALKTHSEITEDSRYQEQDVKQVTHYFNDFNQTILKYLIRQSTSNAINVKRAYKHALVNKVSFESLIIHPIKVSLTFTPTSSIRFSTDPIVQSTHKLRLLQGMHGIPAVEDFEVKIGSFIVNHAMESITSMYRRILIKTRTELKSGLMSMGGSLLGSMSILGKPAGLLKNIGEGAEDFFYEPYLGSMISPSAFVLGIGKGTGAFIGGIATGVFGTTANVVVSATGGLSSAMSSGVESLTGDDYYTRNREEKRRSIGASQGGVLVGMRTGGESLLTGVAAGITGLVTKPIEEGKKTGALGFMKGVGMGLVGVAVKPVLGLTDGISSVASGFTQQITDSSTIAIHYRPQRALERIDPCNYHNTNTNSNGNNISGNNNNGNSNKLLIVPFDIFAADCQYFIKNKAFQNNYNDEYLVSFKLGYQRTDYLSVTTEYGIAISSKYIYCMAANNNLLWDILFTNLSHVIFKTKVNNQLKYAIECILYNMDLSTEKSKTIPCVNKIYAINLYSLLLTFSSKMGFPSKLIPIESLTIDDNNNTTTNDSNNNNSNRKDIDIDANGAINIIPYAFTNKNPCFFPHQKLSDEQIIHIAQEKFQLINIPKYILDISCMNKYYQLLDENMWHLLSNWKYNHHHYASRHSICLIINNSSNDIRLNEIELKEGKGYHILSVDGLSNNTTNSVDNTINSDNNTTTNTTSYDKDSRTLVGNGGSLVIFVYGYTPSLTDLAHVKLKIYSSVFEILISTRKNRSYCKVEMNDTQQQQQQYHLGFLCKTETSDFWSKFVIMIT